MNNLTGVILCGGNSSRMGRDKGLMLKDGIPWARHMGDKLLPFHIPVVLSVNVSQVSGYAALLPCVPQVVDSVDLPGPLKGLLSVHEQFPGNDLLLLACDMPDMDGATIAGLVEAYYADRSFECYAYREGDFYQPFCAIYTSAGMAAAHTAALEGHLQDFSLQGLLRRGKTKSLAILRSEAFRNYNAL